MADFAKAFAVWLTCEGSVAAGIEQGVYDKWRRSWGEPTQAVSKITDIETQKLLREIFWNAENYSVLPQGWAVFCLVEGSNLPYRAAVKIMQNALAWLGFYDEQIDGVIGPSTIAACQKAPARQDAAIVACLGHYAVDSSMNLQKGFRRRLEVLKGACAEQSQ